MKFKKLLMAVIAAGAALCASSAYEWSECWRTYGGTIEEHDIILNAGVGLNSELFEKRKRKYFIPPTEVTFEVTQKIWVLPFGFGAFFGIDGDCYTWKTDAYEYRLDLLNYSFGGLVNYHIALLPEKLDVYAGSKLGLYTNQHKKRIRGLGSQKDTSSRFRYALHLGASWYSTKLFGLNLELGYPIFSKFGVTFKF